MASARFAWGIDIGNRALKAIRLSRADGAMVIDDFDVIEHETVLSNAGDNRDTLIQSALANFVQRHQIKGGSVAISVSGVSSFARFIKLPPVEPKMIPGIVRFEAIQQIPFPLDDVEWSYQLFQDTDSPDVEVGIFAMRRELINAHIKHFTDVDLNVQTVQMNPLAVYNAMYYDGRLKGTTMIVDLGAENTDLIIADGETIWLRSIPIGGNNFTEVLVKSFKLPFAKAEQLKRDAAQSKYARQIFQAMRPVFADLVAEIQRSIGFYASVHRDSRIKNIIALGGTFRLPGLQKYLEQNLQLKVERMDRLAAGTPSDAKAAVVFNENLLSLASAYGLAIQAMGDAKITSSLLPEHIRRAKMWRDKTKWFGAAAAAFVLGSAVAVGGYYLSQLQYDQAATVRQANLDTLTKARALNTKWTKVQDDGAPDRLKINNIRSMLNDRGIWSNLFGDIVAQLPSGTADQGDDPKDAEEIKRVPREQRTAIWIDSLQSYYSDNLGRDVAASGDFTTTAGASGPGAPGSPQPIPGSHGEPNSAPVDPTVPAGSRGFIIALSLTTPHKDGYLHVLNDLRPKLAALNADWMAKYNAAHPDAPKRYYILKVSNPLNYSQIKDDSARLQLMALSYSASQVMSGKKDVETTGAPGGQPFSPGGGHYMSDPHAPYSPQYGPGGSPFQPGQPHGTSKLDKDDPTPYLSRVTGEDQRNDWEMKLELVVVVDPADTESANGGAPE